MTKRKMTVEELKEIELSKRKILIENTASLLTSREFLLLGFEGSGFLNHDQLLEIGIVDPSTIKPIFHSLVKTVIHQSQPAVNTFNGMNLEHESTIGELCGTLKFVFRNSKKIIVYNAKTFLQLLNQSLHPFGLEPSSLGLDQDRIICAMEVFSAWIGDWLDPKPIFKWQRLPYAVHRAIPDCFATLNVLRRVVAEKEGNVATNAFCRVCGSLCNVYSDEWGDFVFCRQCGAHMEMMK